MDDRRVVVNGLEAVRRGMRALGENAEFNDAMKRIAYVVAADARSHVPRRSGAAANSMRPGVSSGKAQVVFGDRRAPYAPWLDFGGSTKVDVNKETRSRLKRSHAAYKAYSGSDRMRVYRPVVSGGRYIYPAIARSQPEIVKAVNTEIKFLAYRYGLGAE